jgi:hypothetical protein
MAKQNLGRKNGSQSKKILENKVDKTFSLDINHRCCKCGKVYEEQAKYFPISCSKYYVGNGNYLPICNDCINWQYLEYARIYDEFTSYRYVCMAFDIYYNKEVVEQVLKSSKPQNRVTQYINKVSVGEHSNKSYLDTIEEEKVEESKITSINDVLNEKVTTTQDDVKKWGFGFEETDYIFLNEKYNSWINRHECKTMAQEEIFKKLSLMDLQILKNMQSGEKYADLLKQYNDYLTSANIKPNQQNDAILADSNTFGTFIKKVENERPISQPSNEWQDIDGIKKYIEVFFLGHLCEMIGIKNEYSQQYLNEMEKYTVNPPTYDDDVEPPNFEDVFGQI